MPLSKLFKILYIMPILSMVVFSIFHFVVFDIRIFIIGIILNTMLILLCNILQHVSISASVKETLLVMGIYYISSFTTLIKQCANEIENQIVKTFFFPIVVAIVISVLISVNCIVVYVFLYTKMLISEYKSKEN